MIRLVVEAKTPHKGRILGASRKTMRAIDKATSFEVEGSFFIKRARGLKLWDGKKHLVSKATGKFPIGLLPRIVKVLEKRSKKFKVEDGRHLATYPLATKEDADKFLVGITLADHQIEALNAALKARGGILHLATNAGKSELGIAIAKMIGLACLWIVPTKLLLKQTRERIAKRLGCSLDEIGAIGGGSFQVGKLVTVAIANSISPRRAKKEDAFVFATKVKRLKAYLDTVQVIMGDEVHHCGSNTWYGALSVCPARYRFGLSGTPLDRSDGKNLLVEALCGPVIARTTNQDLIKIGWSANPTIEVYEVNQPKLKGNRFWQEAYKEGIVENTYRNELIVKRCILAIAKNEPVLILCRDIQHIYNIKSIFRLLAPAICISIAHANYKKTDLSLKKFFSGASNVLIGSPMFGEGVDFPGDRIKTFVNAEALRSPIRTLQKIGRSVRRKTTDDNTVRVIEFADFISKYLASHSLERLELYEKEGFEIVKGKTLV